MPQRSASQSKELDALWATLGTAYPHASPPETDDEVFVEALDSWIAGVMSSRGAFSQQSLVDLVGLIQEREASDVALSIADRVLALARGAGGASE